jgi:transcriptional regulator with XRE-family HTH domain
MAKTNSSPSHPAVVLKAARIEQGLTLRALAARIGMPYSTLSKLENGKMEMTYDKLMRLSQGLGVDLGVLISGSAASSPPAALGRRAVARAGTLPSADEHDRLRLPAADLLGKLMEPAIIEVRARSVAEVGGLVRHAGEEFLYILSGAMELHSDLYAPLRLDTGDSIYFDSGMAHAYVRVTEEPCQVLSVMAGAGIQAFARTARDGLIARGASAHQATE